jgi:hypothetical protein
VLDGMGEHWVCSARATLCTCADGHVEFCIPKAS